MSNTIICKDCGKCFIMKEDVEYIMSYCPGCEKLVVIYKINPAILVKLKEKPPVFVSSNYMGKCRKCGSTITIKNSDSYYSFRCTTCGFGVIYKMPSHRGVASFLSKDDFNKEKYYKTGKRKADREKREQELKK